MYDFADVLPGADLDPGTNVLVAGSSPNEARRIAFDVLASGADRGDGSIVVTTTDDADAVLEAVTSRLDDATGTTVGVVDCVTKQRGIGAVGDDSRVRYASSPDDMTGIGIKLSAFLEEFTEERAVTENRVLLDSISTLLGHSDLQTVFRFLHVFTGRVQSADALGIYVVDPTSHDEQTMNTLEQLFDVVLEVERTDGDEPEVRTVGSPLE